MMKNFATLSWQVDEEIYRNDSALSYSTISRYSKDGFSGIPHLFDKIDTPSLRFGSMVDLLLTSGTAAFDEKYSYADFPPISDSLRAIAQSLFSNYKDIYSKLEDIPDEIISNHGKELGYYSADKYDKLRVKNIREGCTIEYNILSENRDKIIVDKEDYMDAIACKDILKTSNVTSYYFEDNPFDTEIERFYQLKFKGEYENIPIKGMLDLVIVDHVSKCIIPCDLKTTGKPEYEFYKSFMTYNYYIQAKMYTYLLQQTILKDDFYKDYTIMPFRFIVINRKSLTPTIWIYSKTLNSPEETYINVEIKDWMKLAKELHYYLNNDVKVPIGIKGVNNIEEWLNKV